MCKDKIVIQSILQSYVLHWYHTYLIHLGMDRTEAMIFQHLYQPDIIYTTQKKVTNCDNCQCTKPPNKKYGKLPDKLAKEIPQNKLCVGLIGPYVIQHKGKKENLHLKDVAIINTITGWFEVVRYDDKRLITIANLVKTTCLTRYPRPMEILYDQNQNLLVMSS